MHWMFLCLLFFCPLPALSSERADASGAQQGRLIAAVPEDAPPTYFRDRKTGRAAGFAVDVMTTVAQRAGYSVQFVFFKDWNEIISALAEHRADVAPGMGISPERVKQFGFTEPIDAFPVSFFVRTGDRKPDLRIKTAEIGVLAGSIAGERLSLRGYSRLVYYESFGQGLFDLLASKIDAFACPAPTLLRLARESGVEDRITVHGEPITEIRRAIAVRSEEQDTRTRLDLTISGFIGTPEYREIYNKWYGTPRPFWTVQRTVITAGVFVTAVSLLILAWHYGRVLRLNRKLKSAMDQVQVLSGLLPICTACKKIRDKAGDWNSIELYISERSKAEFSHSICPECAQRLYPQYYGNPPAAEKPPATK